MAKLIRDGDGEGYQGSLVEAIDPITGNVIGHEPLIGYRLKVGTMTAGMFTERDWWMTTAITEIISEDDNKMRFKTKNSVYTLFK